jgi:serine/threonine protein kinase
MPQTKVLGRGTYGTVYGVSSPGGSNYAIKRNFICENVRGIGAVRESDLMIRIAHHPHIVHVKKLQCNALNQGPLSPAPKEMVTDPLYFMMQKADSDLEDLIAWTVKNPHYSHRNLKSIAVQILLSLEFLHRSGVIHRDIKPSNVLINYQDNGTKSSPHARLCDFGMALQWTPQGYMTPGVYTPTYKAPEVCADKVMEEAGIAGHGYTYAADVWAMGCLIYYMMAGYPMLPRIIPDDLQLVAILQYGPDEVNPEEVKELLGEAWDKSSVDPSEWDQSLSRKEYLPFAARAIPETTLQKFCRETSPKVSGILDPSTLSSGLYNYIDLLTGMLRWDPKNRLTATQCLDHPWFSEYADHIRDVRKAYPRVEWGSLISPPICAERTWIIDTALDLYNQGCLGNKLNRWYSPRILFHALLAFDRWMEYKLSQAADDSLESGSRGRVYTPVEAQAVFWAMIYLYTKYFQINVILPPYSSIVPPCYRDDPKLQALMDEVEKQLIIRGKLYQITPYEASRSILTTEQIGDLVLMYTSSPCIFVNNLSVYDLVDAYERICQQYEHIEDPRERHKMIRASLLN